MRLGDCGKVSAQPLCARLTDMQRSTDSAYRENTISCQFNREYHCGAFLERIGHELSSRTLGITPASASRE
jgi:hypothetical protein